MIRLHSTHWASLSEYGCNTNTRDFGEVALHVGDHHVFDLELGGRMSRIRVPVIWACNTPEWSRKSVPEA